MGTNLCEKVKGLGRGKIWSGGGRVGEEGGHTFPERLGREWSRIWRRWSDRETHLSDASAGANTNYGDWGKTGSTK